MLQRNIVANYLGRAYSVAAIYLFVPIYVRILGLEAYGLIAFYSVILALISLADVGLSTTFSREAARVKHKSSLLDLLTTIERVLLLTTSLGAFMLFGGADWIASHWLNAKAGLDQEEAAWCLRLMALSLPAQLLISLYSAGLLGLQRQVSANALQASYTTIRSGLVIVPILWMPEPSTFFAWHLVSTCAFAVVARAVLTSAMGLPRFKSGRFAPREMLPLLAFAGGMFVITIIANVNTQLDKLIVSKMFSIQEFGVYTLAATLAQIPVAATSPIAIALYPAITAKLALNEVREAESLYERYTFIIAVLAALGSIGLALFGREVFAVWVASESIPDAAQKAMVLLSLGSLFLCLQLTPYYLSLARNDNWTIAVLAFGTLLLSVPLVYVGASNFGLLGAAMPWLLLNCLNFATLSYFINRRHYRKSHYRWLAKFVFMPVGIGGVAMAAARLASIALGSSAIVACLLALVVAVCAISILWRFSEYLPIAETKGMRS